MVRLGIPGDVTHLHFLLSAAEDIVRRTGLSGTSGSADAVDIVLMILGQVVVKHGIHALDINATGSHIGGDENGISAALEPVHDLGALELFHIVRGDLRQKATETQRLSQLVYHLLGVAEDHGRLGLFRQQEQLERIGLASHGNADGKLSDGIHRPVCALDLHQHRVVLILLGDRQDCRRHGSGEQHGLTFFRNLRQDRLDVLPESHVQHFVRLVQDDGFQIVQFQRPAAEMVEDTSRRADYQIGAVFQLVDLALHAGAAVDSHGLYLSLEPGKLPDLVTSLHRQFPCGAKDQSAHIAALLLGHLSHLFQDRGC